STARAVRGMCDEQGSDTFAFRNARDTRRCGKRCLRSFQPPSPTRDERRAAWGVSCAHPELTTRLQLCYSAANAVASNPLRQTTRRRELESCAEGSDEEMRKTLVLSGLALIRGAGVASQAQETKDVGKPETTLD